MVTIELNMWRDIVCFLLLALVLGMEPWALGLTTSSHPHPSLVAYFGPPQIMEVAFVLSACSLLSLTETAVLTRWVLFVCFSSLF